MINFVICDDNSAYCEILSHKLEQCMRNTFSEDYSLYIFNTWETLKEHLQTKRTDILFLDILLNDKNTMDWSIENQMHDSTQIIFITSYPEAAYAISESKCCYYLIKSRITEETLTKALSRAIQNLSKTSSDLAIVRYGGKKTIIHYSDIVYIESFNNNITLHLNERSDITLYTTLKFYGEGLPLNFLRCHKSYIINMDFVVGYKPHSFILGDGLCVPIPVKKYKTIIADYERYLSTYSPFAFQKSEENV